MSDADAHAEEQRSDAELRSAHDVVRVRAENPSAFTLSGTNTWVVGRDPAWVIDPGPAAADAHVERILATVAERGGLGGIALTHDHADHAGAVAALRARHPAPLAAARGEVDVVLRDGVRFGPLQAHAAPGHSADHFALIGARVCFSGDAVLGEGSVFERRLIAALEEGIRTEEELLDRAWSEVPAILRRAAAVTLAAHLDKLEDEGALPQGVQRGATVRLDEPGSPAAAPR
jgi:glyoxylase-like metal-dependent hydrolase (beta-lactamase superfamily II)